LLWWGPGGGKGRAAVAEKGDPFHIKKREVNLLAGKERKLSIKRSGL